MAKKNILTQKEKEFLMFLLQFYNVNSIVFGSFYIEFYHCHKCDRAQFGYPHKKLKFEKVQLAKVYSLKELGLEE